ncbi:MAG: hypothetical protein HKN47_13020 [Pirellulaceae bacterium]|nr:hypothetical protein [Pirellulaceae bacterium]
MRTRHWASSTAFAITVCCLAISNWQALAAQSTPRQTNRWAIIATDSSSRPLADLLTVELSSLPDIQLVERDQIGRVLDELNLNADGLVAADQSTQFGRISKATGLVLINTITDPASRGNVLRLRLIDTRTSIRLCDTVLARTSIDSDIAVLRDQLIVAKEKLSRPLDELRLISVAPIQSSEPGYLLRPFCRTLTTLVTADLQKRPGLIVLEREDLTRLTNESNLSGLELQLRGATRLVEISIQRTTENRGMTATVRIVSPGNSKIQTRVIEVPSRELPSVREHVVAGILKSVGQNPGTANATSRESEAAAFERRIMQYKYAYRWHEAASMAEAAYALAPTKQRAQSLSSSYRSQVSEYLRTGDQLDAFVTARRHNQLLLQIEMNFSAPAGANDLTKNPATGRRHPPPTVTLQYGRRLEPKSAEQKRLLAEIHRLRRQILDVKIQHATANPLVHFHRLLEHVDLELTTSQAAPDALPLTTDLLQRLCDLTEAANVRNDGDDEYYRALLTRTLRVVGRVFDAKSGSAWYLPDPSHWVSQLSTMQPKIGKVTQLLFLTKRSGDEGLLAARALLHQLDNLPESMTAIEAVDQFLRLPALARIMPADARAYGLALLQQAETTDSARQLLGHSHSAPTFIRGMSTDETMAFARRMLAFVDDVPAEHRMDQFRIRAALHRFARREVTDPDTFSLAKAPGPWRDYQATAIRLDGLAREPRIYHIHVDHRSDAIERGGQLVLVAAATRGKIAVYRVGLASGTPTQVGPELPVPKEMLRDFDIAIGPESIYLASYKLGFTRLTANSAKAFAEADGAASDDIWSMAWLKDRLYIAYNDGFGSYQPSTGRFALLASSMSVQAKNHLDARGSFFIRQLVPDETSNSVWMNIQDNSLNHDASGLWKYDPTSDEFKHLTLAMLDITPAVGGWLVHKSRSPRIEWLDPVTGELAEMPGMKHFTANTTWLKRPTPRLIRIGDHLIGSDGTLLTSDGKRHAVGGKHRWNHLQQIGDGFITHYTLQDRTIWFVRPKPGIGKEAQR